MHQADTTMSFGFGALSGDSESFQRDAEQIRQFEEELRRQLEQEAKDAAAQAAARDAAIASFNVNPKLAGIRRWLRLGIHNVNDIVALLAPGADSAAKGGDNILRTYTEDQIATFKSSAEDVVMASLQASLGDCVTDTQLPPVIRQSRRDGRKVVFGSRQANI